MLIDPNGRQVSYLRLSITDRCNLRCLYCRPAAHWVGLSHEEILTYEEMFQLVKAASLMGVKKVRLTGGEPFVRKDFIPFVARLHKNFPHLDLRITTNGTLLQGQIQSVIQAGVKCLNISMDTLRPDRFLDITGVDVHAAVRASIDACLHAGLRVKINVVALKGINDDELLDFVNFAQKYSLDVRFIEFMPIGYESRWSEENYWSADDIIAQLQSIVSLEEVPRTSPHSGPARMYRINNSSGRIGVISAVSHHFCQTCNRLRVTSDGKLRTCLFSDQEYDLRSILRSPQWSMDELLATFHRANLEKPMGYRLLQKREKNSVCQRAMTAIGG